MNASPSPNPQELLARLEKLQPRSVLESLMFQLNWESGYWPSEAKNHNQRCLEFLQWAESIPEKIDELAAALDQLSNLVVNRTSQSPALPRAAAPSKYTVFVGYAPENNQSKWVSQFVKQLEKRLPGEFKKQVDCRVWFDEFCVGPNQPTRETSLQAVNSADIYLAIVSHAYLRSPDCQFARNVFLNSWQEESKGRLLLIHHQPVSRDDGAWPQEFQDLAGFKFFAEEDDGFPMIFGEDPEKLEHAYRLLIHKVAWTIAGIVDQIESARTTQVPKASAESGTTPMASQPAQHANVLVIAPKDMDLEGQLLRRRIQELGRLRMMDQDVEIVLATFEDILAITRDWKPVQRPVLDVIVIVVWTELGLPEDGAREACSLVEAAYQIACERGARVLIYRCHRELSLAPLDPDLDKKVANFRRVNEFFSLFQEGVSEQAVHRAFRSSAELREHFDSDLKTVVAHAVEQSSREPAHSVAEEPEVSIPNLGDVLESYLDWVISKHERLELRGIGGTSSLATVPLEEVYVALRGVRATDDERQQSRALFHNELFSTIQAMPEGIPVVEFMRMFEEAEDRTLVRDPLMPFLVERDRATSDGRPSTEVTMSLGEAFRTERWLVVLGDPGSGKTTLLRWIARKLAQSLQAAQQEGANPDHHLEVPAYQIDPDADRRDGQKVDLGPSRLPILVRVSEFADALLNARKNGAVLPLVDFLGSHTWEREPYQGDPQGLNLLIRSYLKKGRAVVLLDGMDEVTASSHRDEVVRAVESFIADWINLGPGGRKLSSSSQGEPWNSGGNQIMITSRIAGYHASPIVGTISHMTVQPMQRRAVEHFCDSWTLAVHLQTLRDSQGENVSPEAVAKVTLDAREESKRLKAEIYHPKSPQLWELASNPLLITILALIFRKRKGQLPRQRSELYHTALEVLIENWRFADITTDEFIYVLSPLASLIHREYSTGLVREEEMREIITEELARYRGESSESPPPQFKREVKSFLRRVREDVGLIAERSTGLYGFLHLTFQEYLAGLYLVRDRKSAGQTIVNLLDDPRWREPILLALGHVSTNPDWGPSARTQLLRQILDADDPLEDLLPRGPLLVVRALSEMENVPNDLLGELLGRLLQAYLISGNDETLSALTQQIEKAVNTVYNSRHQEEVVSNIVNLLESTAPTDLDRKFACANLIRANGWMHPRFAGPLLRCQPYDSAQWSLPVTKVLRNYTSREMPELDISELEWNVAELRQQFEAFQNGSRQRKIQEEIAELYRRLEELGGESNV